MTHEAFQSEFPTAVHSTGELFGDGGFRRVWRLHVVLVQCWSDKDMPPVGVNPALLVPLSQVM